MGHTWSVIFVEVDLGAAQNSHVDRLDARVAVLSPEIDLVQTCDFEEKLVFFRPIAKIFG